MKSHPSKPSQPAKPTAEELEDAAANEHFANYKLDKTPEQFENCDMLVHGPFDPEKNYFDYLAAESHKATMEWHRKKRLLREQSSTRINSEASATSQKKDEVDSIVKGENSPEKDTKL